MAFYVAGEDGAVLNALMLFDEYFAWKAKQMAKEIEVNIYTHAGVELDEDKICFSPEALYHKGCVRYQASPRCL